MENAEMNRDMAVTHGKVHWTRLIRAEAFVGVDIPVDTTMHVWTEEIVDPIVSL